MASSKKRKTKKLVGQVNEPLAEYFKSEKYLESFRRVGITTVEEMEEANRIFSASLTPVQRLELLTYLLSGIFDDEIKHNTINNENIIYFDSP